MSAATKRKMKPRLLTHRTVAQMMDVDTETLRDWVADGEFPEPVAVISRTWFYDQAVVEEFIETGRWPEGTKFKSGVGRGRVESNG